MVPGWVQWHAMSCSDAQEPVRHTNTTPIAGTPVLLKSFLSLIVLHPAGVVVSPWPLAT